MIRLLRIFVPAGVFALFVSEFALTLLCYLAGSYLALDLDPFTYLFYDGGWQRALIATACLMLGMSFQNLYSEVRLKSRVMLLQRLVMVIGVSFLAEGLIGYILPDWRAPLRMVIAGNLLALPALFLWRQYFSGYALGAMTADRALLMGDSPLLEELGAYMAQHPESGYQVVGYVRDGEPGTSLPGGDILGPVAELNRIVEDAAPRRIVVGMKDWKAPLPVVDLLELRFAGHVVEEAAALYPRLRGRVRLSEIRPSQLAHSGDLGPRPQAVFYQTFWNALLAMAGVIALSPVLLAAALAVRLTSRGPVLARHPRTGLNCEIYRQLKFRTLLVDPPSEDASGWDLRKDPRLTPVGPWLRRTRIDLLPQLFNVLAGEMAIVGPRPEHPAYTEAIARHVPYYRHRYCVRPGITGWAQVSHDPADGPEDAAVKLEYDLFYIKNMSFGMDTMALFHALKAAMAPEE